MRKLFCLFICVLLLFAMTVPAYAEDTDPSQNTPTETQHVCTWDAGVVTKEATCIADGEKLYTCTGCGSTKTEVIPATGKHTYGSGVKLDENNHEHTCTGCGAKITSAHTWDAGVENPKATCQQSGVMTYTCTGCGHTKTETVPQKTTHNYGPWNGDEVIHERICNDCGKVDSGDHHWDNGTVTVKPTCKSYGKKEYHCSGCTLVLEETLDMLTTHTYDNACDPDCNVCGKTRTVSHSFTTVWSSDYTGHWHECTKCGETKDFAKHVPGPAATEEKAQVCLTCGYEVTPKKDHVHNYEKTWSSDDAGHWHACSGCTNEKDYAAHTYDDACDVDCNVCGYKKETAHTYDGEWQTTDKEHWNICTVCGEESEHEKHVPGPEATDEEAQLCTICGYEIAPMLEHEHDFGDEWVQTEDSHWQECKCGELSVPEPHTWDEGTENRDDTITYTCTVCGAEKTEEAPSSGIPWVIIILVLLALVCIGGIVALVIILKRGGFDDEDDDE